MDSQLIFDSSIENPLVTIAIPTYKRDEMLVEAVSSALNQDTNIAYDVLVVDNNPERDDITEQAMSQFANHPQVSYYKNNENIGMIGNWNRLYELSKGKYVTMLHDDDMLFPFYLKAFVSVLESFKFKYELIYPNFFLSKDRDLPLKEISPNLKCRKMKVEDFAVTQWGLPSGMMILREKFGKTRGFSQNFYPLHDQEFIYRALHDLRGCQLYNPSVFYYIGANASMKPDVMKGIIIKEKELNHIMRKDRKNHFRMGTVLCYRHQMNNIINWGSRFVGEDVIRDAKLAISLKDNIIKDNLSKAFAMFIKCYIYIVRFSNIKLNNSL